MSIKKSISKFCDGLGDVPLIGGVLKPKPKVAVIRMAGVIADAQVKRGGISYARFSKSIEEAFELYKVKAVALVINSPGGSPAQSQLIGDAVRRLREEKDVPVYAFVEDVAASGGYWLSCAADEIYALQSSIVGSIGVISAGFGAHELIAKHGVERRVYTSGKDKGFLDPFLEEKPADVKRLKTLQKALHTQFINWVKDRRGDKLKGEDKTLFEGAFWDGASALELGLIDGFGEMRSICKDKFGEEIKFVEFTPEKGFISSLLNPEAKIGLSEEALQTIEAKSIWARYGL